MGATMDTVLVPLKERYLSAKDYLKEIEKNRLNNNIERVEFIPPKIGKGGYGSFRIKYRVPVLVEE